MEYFKKGLILELNKIQDFSWLGKEVGKGYLRYEKKITSDLGDSCRASLSSELIC